MSIEEEQIQNNCNQIQELLQQYPNRKITVQRIETDKCKIIEKETKKVLFENNTEKTLQRLEKLLDQTQAEINFKRILEIAKHFPESKIRIEKLYIDWCRLTFPSRWSYTFCLSKNDIDTNIKEIKNMFLEEQIQELIKNSQYSWMKLRETFNYNKWQIVDSKNKDRVRFEDTLEKIAEVIKEITQNQ